jgi:hypothetical protein
MPKMQAYEFEHMYPTFEIYMRQVNAQLFELYSVTADSISPMYRFREAYQQHMGPSRCAKLAFETFCF